MFCGKCGQDNTDDVRFCTACGADLGAQTPRRGSGANTLDAVNTIQGDALAPGKSLGGRYQIAERLGSGGMGEVWKALDREMDNMAVAVKVLPPVLARNRHSVEALKREAAISLKLSHPNICRLHTFSADGPIKFLVMEYIDGQTLEEALDKRSDRRLTMDETITVARRVGAALDYAHAQRPPILHRDIKPSNVMIARGGGIKLLDFGIAREMKDSMTRVTGNQTSGTLLYMSPEQFEGKPLTAASDIYSLGAMLFECLAGHPPFHQGSVGHQLLHVPPGDIPDVPRATNAALQAALSKDPAGRPASASELARAMAEGGAAVGGRASPPAVVPPAGRRSWGTLIAGLVAVCLCLAGVGVWMLTHGNGRRGEGEPSPPPATSPVVAILPPASLPATTPALPAVILADVEPVKLAAEAAYKLVQGFDPGQGAEKMLADTARAYGTAKEAYDKRAWVEAKAGYEDLKQRCQDLRQFEQSRSHAAKARDEAQTAQDAAKQSGAADDAQSLWKTAGELHTRAAGQFDKGDFEPAQKAWEEAKTQFADASRRAQGVARVRAAKSDYETALKSHDTALLDKYGQNDWKAVTDAVAGARNAGDDFDAAAAAYKRARELLPAAKRMAEARELQARVDVAMSAANSLVGQYKYAEALDKVNEALRLSAHDPAAEALREQIEQLKQGARRALLSRARSLILGGCIRLDSGVTIDGDDVVVDGNRVRLAEVTAMKIVERATPDAKGQMYLLVTEPPVRGSYPYISAFRHRPDAEKLLAVLECLRANRWEGDALARVLGKGQIVYRSEAEALDAMQACLSRSKEDDDSHFRVTSSGIKWTFRDASGKETPNALTFSSVQDLSAGAFTVSEPGGATRPAGYGCMIRRSKDSQECSGFFWTSEADAGSFCAAVEFMRDRSGAPATRRATEGAPATRTTAD